MEKLTTGRMQNTKEEFVFIFVGIVFSLREMVLNRNRMPSSAGWPYCRNIRTILISGPQINLSTSVIDKLTRTLASTSPH